MELEGRRGRGTKEQREEERGGGRQGDREAEWLPFISKTYFLYYNMQIKRVLGSGLVFKNVRLLMYSLRLSIQLSDADVLKLEPMAARETWKYHLTKLKALVYILGKKEASGWKIFKKEHTPFSLPGLTKYSVSYKHLIGTLCKQHIYTQCTHSLLLGFSSKRGQSHELVVSLLSEPIIV